MTRYWLDLLNWAQEHYRYRTFRKDERVPARTGLLYLVHQGIVRLVGESQISVNGKGASRRSPMSDEAFLGFVGVGQPFEVIEKFPYTIKGLAHVDQTSIIWFYWEDLEQFPDIRDEILEAFRNHHQRKLLWLNTLGQRRTVDRLLGFLRLLIEEFGEPCEGGFYLPFALTHAQIGSAIGSTRVTVTRLMGKLRQRGLLGSHENTYIFIPESVGRRQSSS
jgi:CRP-like cAMP-binding protein